MASVPPQCTGQTQRAEGCEYAGTLYCRVMCCWWACGPLEPNDDRADWYNEVEEEHERWADDQKRGPKVSF